MNSFFEQKALLLAYSDLYEHFLQVQILFPNLITLQLILFLRQFGNLSISYKDLSKQRARLGMEFCKSKIVI